MRFLLLSLVFLIGFTMTGCGTSEQPMTQGDSSGDQQVKITGKVTDEQGNPVEGALITPISKDQPPKMIPEIAVFTNAEGKFTWNLPAGKYDFKVQKEGYQEAVASLEAQKGSKVDITLKKK